MFSLIAMFIKYYDCTQVCLLQRHNHVKSLKEQRKNEMFADSDTNKCR